MIEIGFHTDAFNSSYWSFEQALQWAQKNDVHWIECGMIDGVSWIHGLGYQPHVAMWEDPKMWQEKAAKYGVKFSQIDAAFPMSLPEGASLGVEYTLRTIRWAYLAGCDHIDTTDDRFAPKGTDPRPGTRYDEAVLRADHGSRRTLPDDHRYRTSWFLHDETRVHGKNACFCG